MTIRNLLGVSGTCIAIMAAGAIAQQNRPNNQPANNQPERTPGQVGTQSPDQIKQLLQKRQGIWEVEVQLNSEFWSGMNSGSANRQPNSPTSRDATDRGNTPAGDNNLDNNNKPRIITPEGMMQLHGYAESDLVLGDHTLRERIVVPMGGELRLDPTQDRNRQPSDRPNQPSSQPAGQPSTTPGSQPSTRPGNQPGEPAAMHSGDQRFGGISYIQFNESDHTYDMVFISNMHEGIQYDTGYFDAQRNRIVFRGGTIANQSAGHGAGQDAGRGAGQEAQRDVDPASRQTGAPKGDLRKPGTNRGLDNVIVVLEFVDDDTHRVTMYQSDSWNTDGRGIGQPGDTTKPAQGNDPRQPGQDDNARRPGQDDSRQPERDARNPTDTSVKTAGEFGSIVYQATYQRAPDSMEARIRSIIDSNLAIASAD